MVNVNLNEIKRNNKNNLQYQGYAALKYCKKQQFLGFNNNTPSILQIKPTLNHCKKAMVGGFVLVILPHTPYT